MKKTHKSTGVSSTVVAIPATVADEPAVVALLKAFAWDDPPLRVARLSANFLAIDLAEVADDGAVARLQCALGRPVTRMRPSEGIADGWTILVAGEDDG